MIQTSGLTKRYGSFTAVDGIGRKRIPPIRPGGRDSLLIRPAHA